MTWWAGLLLYGTGLVTGLLLGAVLTVDALRPGGRGR